MLQPSPGPRAGLAPLLAGVALAAVLPSPWCSIVAQGPHAQTPPVPRVAAATRFVANAGQWEPGIAFGLQQGGAGAWLDARGIRLELDVPEPLASAPPEPAADRARFAAPFDARPARRLHTLRLGFDTGIAVEPVGETRTPTLAHFAVGDDQSRWCRDVPTWSSVCWHDVLPGAAMRVRTHPGGILEYELHLEPGFDSSALVLCWDGADALSPQDDGSLRVDVDGAHLRQSAPIAWQPLANGARIDVPVRLEMLDHRRFRFAVDDARPDLPLVIDPVLQYVGGPGNDAANGVARDSQNRVYVCGRTVAPGTTNRDALVACVDFSVVPPVVQWTMTLGGAGDDQAFDIDEGGLLTVVGFTTSSDYPTINPLQRAYGGGQLDGFVTQLTPVGTIVHSTWLGGNGDDWCCRIVSDERSQATVAGYTSSTAATFPISRDACQGVNAGSTDAFVTQIPPGGGAVGYSTFLGGSGADGLIDPGWRDYPIGLRDLGLDVDAAGRVLIAGTTISPDFPRAPGTNAGQDGFAAIVDPATGPRGLLWSTYVGGAGTDWIRCAAFGAAGQVVVAGATLSNAFPTTSGAFQTTHGGASDAFVTYLDPSQPPSQQLRYSTYLGAAQSDAAHALDVDARGHATVAGWCGLGFPSGSGWPNHAGGHQLVFGGGEDMWVARLRPEGRGREDLTHGTYIGGSGPELINDLELEPDGGVAIAGGTGSTGIPLTQGTLAGSRDVLVGTLELLPTNVTRRLAGSVPGCGGTMLLEVDRRLTAGAPFELLVGNAPPTATGVLAFGTWLPCLRLPGGGKLCVNPLVVTPALVSSPQTAFSLRLVLPASLPPPLGIDVQALWIDTGGCVRPWSSVSSAVLTL